MKPGVKLACLLAGALCGCSSEQPEPVVRVDLVAPPDGSCLGVSGFVVEVSVGGVEAGTLREAKPRSKPVLSSADCKLDTAVSLQGVDLEQPLDITVQGQDGAGNVRVRGVLHFDRLRGAPDGKLQLSHAGEAGTEPAPVLLIDREAALLGGKPLTSLDSVEVTRQPAATLILKADKSAAFFSVGEPWAAQLAAGQQLTEGEEISIRGVLEKNNVGSKAVVVNRGGYFEAVVAR
jgi:hypothetical protein